MAKEYTFAEMEKAMEKWNKEGGAVMSKRELIIAIETMEIAVMVAQSIEDDGIVTRSFYKLKQEMRRQAGFNT